jgi:hypothetical protein
MPYTIKEEKTYSVGKDKLIQAILAAVKGLEGELLKNEPETGQIVAKFKKTILGNVLGDRTQLELAIQSPSADETKLDMTVYPINPVGQKLQFGARKGVPKKVLTWFLAHVDHHLK